MAAVVVALELVLLVVRVLFTVIQQSEPLKCFIMYQ